MSQRVLPGLKFKVLMFTCVILAKLFSLSFFISKVRIMTDDLTQVVVRVIRYWI